MSRQQRSTPSDLASRHGLVVTRVLAVIRAFGGDAGLAEAYLDALSASDQLIHDPADVTGFNALLTEELIAAFRAQQV